MYYLRRVTITFAVIAGLLFIIWLLPRVLTPTPPSEEEEKRNARWVNSSPYWLDRQACRWVSLCGLHHVRWDAPALPKNGTDDNDDDSGDLRFDELRRRFVSVEGGLGESWLEAPAKREAGASGDRLTAREEEGNATLKEIPEFVLKYAPLVHLYSGENFWPSDIVEHLQHMLPVDSKGRAVNKTHPIDLSNLGDLNGNNHTVFLNSDVDVETRPEWLHSHSGIPVPYDENDGEEGGGNNAGDNKDGQVDRPRRNGDGSTWWDVDRDHPLHRIADPRRLYSAFHGSPRSSRRPSRQRRDVFPNFDDQYRQQTMARLPSMRGHKPDEEGYSKGPAVLVMVDKGSGILDAYWFYFYSYNLGQTVFNIRFGNHVGDWEHCMIRFQNGVPRAMFLSEHEGGKAYAWDALEKRHHHHGGGRQSSYEPDRPVIYSAVGSHAMYATPGKHPYVLPFEMLKDVTDRGPLWDPSKNNYAFFYDYELGNEGDAGLTPAASNPDVPTSWFHFKGYWGDDIFPLGDTRQWRLFQQYHYVTGPEGPKAKDLDRRKVCPGERCRMLYSLEEGKKATWYN